MQIVAEAKAETHPGTPDCAIVLTSTLAAHRCLCLQGPSGPRRILRGGRGIRAASASAVRLLPPAACGWLRLCPGCRLSCDGVRGGGSLLISHTEPSEVNGCYLAGERH